MQIDPLPEVVHVTVFMEGIRPCPARTEVFRVHPLPWPGMLTSQTMRTTTTSLIRLVGMGITRAPLEQALAL